MGTVAQTTLGPSEATYAAPPPVSTLLHLRYRPIEHGALELLSSKASYTIIVTIATIYIYRLYRLMQRLATSHLRLRHRRRRCAWRTAASLHRPRPPSARRRQRRLAPQIRPPDRARPYPHRRACRRRGHERSPRLCRWASSLAHRAIRSAVRRRRHRRHSPPPHPASHQHRPRRRRRCPRSPTTRCPMRASSPRRPSPSPPSRASTLQQPDLRTTGAARERHGARLAGRGGRKHEGGRGPVGVPGRRARSRA